MGKLYTKDLLNEISKEFGIDSFRIKYYGIKKADVNYLINAYFKEIDKNLLQGNIISFSGFYLSYIKKKEGILIRQDIANIPKNARRFAMTARKHFGDKSHRAYIKKKLQWRKENKLFHQTPPPNRFRP